MEKSTLQTVRRLVPGTLWLVAGSSFLLRSYSPSSGWRDLRAAIGSSALVVVLGVLYRGTGLQEAIHNFTWRTTVDDYLKARLLDLLPDHELSAVDRRRLSDGMRLINLFYSVVDKDPSLSNKMGDIYENGAYLGSAGDVACVATAMATVHFCLTLVGGWPWAPGWILVSGGAFFLAAFYLPLGVRRHMRLADEQLDYIRVNLQDDVAARLRALAESTLSHRR